MLGVTTNVGCRGPHTPGRVDALTKCAHQAVRRGPVVVFVQEASATQGWLKTARRELIALPSGSCNTVPPLQPTRIRPDLPLTESAAAA